MKKNLCLFLMFFASLFYSQVKNVDAATFKKLVDEKKGILIDLRTDDEIKKRGMIRGAVQIDFLAKDAEAQIGKLDHSTPYLIYCAGGVRSEECGALMLKMGFADITNLEKGFAEWKTNRFEVESRQ